MFTPVTVLADCGRGGIFEDRAGQSGTAASVVDDGGGCYSVLVGAGGFGGA